MTVRLLHIFCAFVCLSAGAVLTLWVLDRRIRDPEVEKLLNRPSVVEQFKKLRSDQYPSAEESSPLVVAAQSFSSHLNGPPVRSERKVVAAPRKIQRSSVRLPRVRIAPSAKFALEGTSHYESQPERSIALISEPGSPERNKYWVKEGERLGHFVIQRIRHGVIVYRDENQQLHEMTIAHKAASRSLVRDYISSVAMAQDLPDSNSGKLKGSFRDYYHYLLDGGDFGVMIVIHGSKLAN